MESDAAALFRFCPRCGVEAGSDLDLRCYRCPHCGFSLWFNVSTSVSAIVTDGAGRVLLLERSKDPGLGLWTLPGGFAEPGEDAESALRREVVEETGVTLGALGWVCAFPNRYAFGGVVYPTMDLVFHAELPPGGEVLLSEESAGFVWLPPVEIDCGRFAFRSLARGLAVYRAGLSG